LEANHIEKPFSNKKIKTILTPLLFVYLLQESKNKMERPQKNRTINGSLLLIVVINIFVIFHLGYYKSAVSSGDSAGYYSYLPAYFIEHDFEFIRQIIGLGEDYSGDQVGPFVNKYTCGVAILQSPFFAIGHLMPPKCDILGEKTCSILIRRFS